MMKRMKKGISLTVALIFLMSFSCVSVFAGTTNSTIDASAPTIQSVTYDNDGEVNIEFQEKVRYKKTKVTVQDAAGNKYTARIQDKDNDELDFYVRKIKEDTSYSFTISGIKRAKAASYTSVSGSFSVPAADAIEIESIEYDEEDRELSFEFVNNVCWKNRTPVVKITDADGTAVKTRVTDRDRDSLDIRVNLDYDTEYQYSIAGIAPYGSTNYITVTDVFQLDDIYVDWDDDDDDDDDDWDDDDDDYYYGNGYGNCDGYGNCNGNHRN